MEELEHYQTFKNWLKIIETDAIYDGTPPTTFNWWGSVGLAGGKVIDRDVPVKKKRKKLQ